MKTTGALWNAYLASWPDGQWFDDSDETYDCKEPVEADAPANAVVEFSCGTVLTRDNKEVGGLVPHFRKWLNARDHITVLCEIPKQHEEALRAFLKQHGGKAVA